MKNERIPLILIIDDDFELRMLRQQLLQKHGCRVITSESGSEGLTLAEKHIPDLILLDVVMPEMSGLDVLAKLRTIEKAKDIFVVLISGLQKSSDEITRGLQSGADGYLISPIPNNLLLAQLDTFIRQKQDMDKLRESENDIWSKNEELEITHQKLEQKNLEYQTLNAELKKTLKSLTLSEKKYKLLAENLDDVIWTITPTGKFKYVSPSVMKMKGYTPEDIMRMKVGETLDKASSAKARKILEKIRQDEAAGKRNDTFSKIELKHLRKDGSSFWTEVNLSPIRNEEGKLIEILGVTRDIDEKRRIQDNLAKNLERYSLAQRIGRVGNWEYNIESGDFWGSDEAKRIYGFDPEADKFSTGEVEDRIPDREQVHQALVDLIEKGKPYDIVFDINPKNSTEPVTIHSMAELVSDDKGKPFKVAGVIQDVTKQKKAEQALIESEGMFKNLADTTPTAILLYQDDHWVYANKAATEITGYDAEELMDMTFWEFVQPEFKNLVKERGRLRQKQQIALQRYEFKIITKLGKSKWVYLSGISTIYRGKPAGIISVLDINPLKQHEIALTESEEKYRLLLENTGSGIGYYSLKGKVLMFNQQAAGLMGGKPSDFLGKTVFELYGKEFGGKYHDRILETSKTDKNLEFEDAVDMGGKKLFFLSTYSRIKNSEGRIIGVQIISKDITARKQAELRLAESEERFRFLSDVTFEAIVVHRKGKVLDVNKSFEKLTGYTKSEAIGQSLFESLTSDEDFKRVQENLKKDHAKPYEVQATKKDGTIFWAEIEGRYMVRNNEQIRIVAIRDVTKRVLARQELKQSEEKYRLVVNNSLEGIFVIQNGLFVYANPAVEYITGHSLKENTNLNFLDFVYDDDKTLVAENYKKRLRGEDVTPYDMRIVDQDRNPRWVRLNATRIMWNNKMAVLCFISDIHHRKIAEDALAEREKSLKNVVENSINVFYNHDANHLMNFVSPQIESVLGYKPDEALVKWTSLVSDHPLNEKGYRLTVKALETGEIQKPYELELIHKNGQKVWVEVREVPVIENGKTIGLAGSLTDITERKNAEQALKESEKRFRTYVQASPIAIFITNNKGQYKFVNPAATKMLGYPEQEFLNLSIADILPEDQLQTGMKNFEEVKKTGYAKTTEIKVKTKDGRIVDMMLEAVKLSDDAFMGYSRDITELKNVQRDLQRANEEFQVLNEELEKGNEELHKINLQLAEARDRAEESDRLKSAFLANMSHEIRTPMNGILGFAELLREPGLTGEQKERYVEVIEKSGQRMLNIINDLINISKIESGQMEVTTGDTNVYEQVETCFHFFEPEARKKDITLSYSADDKLLNPVVVTDGEKLYAVLINLIKNAIKFTNEGSISFGYQVTKYKQDKALEFFVKDTGIGIPEDKQKLIFERFVQADSTLARPYEGAGLGLSISRAYVEMLGGHIRVDSEIGTGSAFYFTIPLDEQSTALAMGEQKAEQEPVGEDIKLKVLIAEDTEASDLYLTKVLEDVSPEILHAANGKEAVEMVRNNPDIDLVLMDIKMPVMGGYDAIRNIRTFNTGIIVIAQTAYAMSGDREKALEAGANDYMAKPVKKSRLLRMIYTLFSGINQISGEAGQ